MLFLGGIVKSLFKPAINVIANQIATPIGDALKSVGKIADTFMKIGGEFFNPIGLAMGGPAGAMLQRAVGTLAHRGALPLPRGIGGLLTRLPKHIQSALQSVGDNGRKMQIHLAEGLQTIDKLLGKPSTERPSDLPSALSEAEEGGSRGDANRGLVDAAAHAYGEMADLNRQIEALDPKADDYQAKLMKIQMRMQQISQAISMISNILTTQHRTAMNVIGNIRS